MVRYDITIHPDEPRYWAMWGLTLLGGLAFLYVWRRWVPRSGPGRDRALHVLGAVLLAGNLVLPVYQIVTGAPPFSIHRSLPLHFCGLNYLIVAVNCYLRNPQLFTFSFFLGIIGGVHSFLTPQLTLGDAPFVLVEYCAKHGAIVFVPLLMMREYGMRIPRGGWRWTYGAAAVLSCAVLAVNWGINTAWPHTVSANYMYVWEAPKVNNPLVRAEWGWPLYLAPLHAALIAHLLLVNAAVRKWGPL